MKHYDVFKSQGGYGVALGIYLDSPVVGSIRWFETEADAVEYAKNKKMYDKEVAALDKKLEYMTESELEALVWPKEEDYGLDKGITI